MSRKRIISIITAVFLSMLVILTFFSKTILNSTLPIVRTHNITSGTISPTVTCVGMVELPESILLTAEQNLTILEICVEEGDITETGDVLFRVLYEDDGTLKQMNEQLIQLETSYQRMLLSADVPTGSSNWTTQLQLNSNLTVAQSNLTRCNEYLEARASLDADLSAAELELEEVQSTYISVVSPCQTEYDSASTAYSAAQATAELARANETYAKSLFDADPEKEQQYLDAKVVREQAEADENAALNRLYTAESNLQTQIQLYEPSLQAAQASVSTIKSEITNLELEYVGCTDLTQCQNAVWSAQGALASFYDSIAASEAANELENIEITNMEISIQHLREEIAEREATLGEGTLVAKENSRIDRILVEEGDQTMIDTCLLELEAYSAFYTVRIPVVSEEAELLSPGMSTVLAGSNGYPVSFTSIEDGRYESEKTLVFEVSRNITVPGQSVTLIVSLNAGRYDIIVPNSAIFEDAQGSFVYRLDRTASPLGSKYVVTRIPVKVLASDDRYSAVDGAISIGMDVILYASTPLQSDQVVRPEG